MTNDTKMTAEYRCNWEVSWHSYVGHMRAKYYAQGIFCDKAAILHEMKADVAYLETNQTLYWDYISMLHLINLYVNSALI